MPDPVVAALLETSEPPPGFAGRRQLVVRWSDGSIGVAASFHAEEILLSEGDLVGRTQAEILALVHRRDVEYLRRKDAGSDDW